MTRMIVEQLGLAMIPWCCGIAAGLTSGTTNGTPRSMRKAEELSTTTAPASTANRAISTEIDAPAEKSAKSTPLNESGPSTWTSICSPLYATVFPFERGDARGRSSLTGKPRLSST